MITLMDKVLRAFGLDLKFTIYKCLATGSEDGLMEFVEGSQTIQKAR
jgi:phosphatidylinositol kinase/protein kinase (PI-3  family)